MKQRYIIIYYISYTLSYTYFQLFLYYYNLKKIMSVRLSNVHFYSTYKKKND